MSAERYADVGRETLNGKDVEVAIDYRRFVALTTLVDAVEKYIAATENGAGGMGKMKAYSKLKGALDKARKVEGR